MPATIFLVGLNHRTAPVELREQFFLTADNVRLALDALHTHLDEVIVLSTCNRLEMYGVTDDPEAGIEAVAALAARTHGLTPDELRPHLYTKTDTTAIEHAMRVASGLDSLVLGEPQILGQVSHALAQAQVADAVGPILSHIFTGAIHAGKRARSETEISRHTVSISHAAAQLVARQTTHMESPRVLVVGAGEMAELAAKGLQAYGISAITIVGRTLERATGLAERLNVCAVPWKRLTVEMANTDVVLTATGAPHLVVHAEAVAHAQVERGERPLLLVDVAVPRDIDQAVTQVPGVTLFDIDDLKDVIDINHGRRAVAAHEVEGIIAQELEQNVRWLQSREIVPVIVDLRRKAEALAEAEVEQALRRLHTHDAHDQAVVEQMAYRIINKLLHTPITTLKAHAGSSSTSDYAQIVRELFELEAIDALNALPPLRYLPRGEGRLPNQRVRLCHCISFTKKRISLSHWRMWRMAEQLPTVRIGTRGSALARWQTDYVADQLRKAWPDLRVEIEIITTHGDVTLDTPLPLIGGKGVFTAELEAALRAGNIDFAVHSLKDLPTETPSGLTLGAIPRRADPRDSLISRGGHTLESLPQGATVGTSSRRRGAQLLTKRPDLHLADIRGNIDTRIRKALDADGPYDAIVLATAGVERLSQMDVVSQLLPLSLMLPAPGQAALAVQCRADDASLALVAPLNDLETQIAVTAERAFLDGLGGGCSLPIAAYAQIDGDTLHLHGRVSAPDGSRQIDIDGDGEASVAGAVSLGRVLAKRALSQGAGELIGTDP